MSNYRINHFALLFTKKGIISSEEIKNYPLEPYLSIELTEHNGDINEINFKISGEMEMTHKITDENLFNIIKNNSIIGKNKSLYKKFVYYVDKLEESEILLIKGQSKNFIKNDDIYTFFISGIMTYIFLYYVLDCGLLRDFIPFNVDIPVTFSTLAFFNRNVFSYLNLNLTPMRRFMSPFWTPIISLVSNFFNLFSNFFVYGVNIDHCAQSMQAVEIVSGLTFHVSNILSSVKKQQENLKKELLEMEKEIINKIDRNIAKIERDVHNALIDITAKNEIELDEKRDNLKENLTNLVTKEIKNCFDRIEDINENLESRLEKVENRSFKSNTISKPYNNKDTESNLSWDERILKNY